MRFLFYFRLSSYLLIASGFLALLITEDYGILSAIIFALIIIIGWRVDSGDLTFRLSRFWWNFATILFLLFCIADALFLRRLKSVALVNFLVFLQMTKIFTPKQHRDYVTIYVISFFELLVSSIMTFSILFALACILFAIFTTWALITLHLKKEIEAHIIRSPEGSRIKTEKGGNSIKTEQTFFNIPALNTLLNNKFFLGTFGITLLTFSLAFIIFAILPRVREGFFFRYGLDIAPQISGFSEEVELDSFGTIRLNYRPVMRVGLPDITDLSQLPEKFYWKGLSYNHYDGKRWKSDPKSRKHLSVNSRYRELYWFTKQSSTDNLLVQNIELNSSRYEVLFGADRIRAAEGRFLSLQHDKVTGNTHVIFAPYALNYKVYSDTTPPPQEALRNDRDDYSENFRRTYLQLPELAERIKELAHQIGDTYDNDYDKAVAIQEYLMQNYEYSLNVQRTPDLLPIEDFLFVNTAGHCEYYATSMAILLRILGIPTRIVNGFAQGRWNEFGNFFTVRQSDAHAWVEVFFPSYGWVTFDPTPPVAFGDTYQQFVEQRSLIASIYRYSEYLRVRWNRYIVDYSREDQVNAVIGTYIATRSFQRNFKNSIARLKQRLKETITRISWRDIAILVGIVGTGILFMYGLSRLFPHFHIRFPSLRKQKNRTRKKTIKFYHTMLHILAKKGIVKHLSVTPGEFARYIARQYAYYERDVRHITDMYYTARYGYTELTQQDLSIIDQKLKTMRKTRVAGSKVRGSRVH